MISIKNLGMTYRSQAAEHLAVAGVSLDVAKGQFYTLLGPSGCGKTTTLRCVAGLERPDAGEITVGNEVVFSAEKGIWIEPNNRNIGMVFQSYAIWPHMSVFDNVAFPLRHQYPRPSRKEIRDKVLNALALVQLHGLEGRPAPYLSGGQQQRLALARALVAEPRVLLLDEPLSNLDAKLREEMRLELRDLVKRLNVTTLFVTHEQIEALTMSDTIAVMKDGIIVQQGTPTEIYSEPREPFVADFIGRTNFFKAKIISLDGPDSANFARVSTPVGTLSCRVKTQGREGDAVLVAVRPEFVELRRGGTPGPDNEVAGEVKAVQYLGNLLDCVVRIGDTDIRVQLHPSQGPNRGDTVTLRLPPEHCLVMHG